MEESQRAQQLIALGIRHHAFYTITYSGAKFRNPKTIRVKVKCFLFIFTLTFQLA